jgi:hypothetical protein
VSQARRSLSPAALLAPAPPNDLSDIRPDILEMIKEEQKVSRFIFEEFMMMRSRKLTR